MRLRVRLLVLSAVFAGFAACSNSGSPVPPLPGVSATPSASAATAVPSHSPTPAPSASAASAATLAVSIVVDMPLKGVAGAIDGVSISLSPRSGTAVLVDADVSPGVTSCTSNGAYRSCVIPVAAPLGVGGIGVTTYDMAPVGGLIPAAARALSTSDYGVDIEPGGPTTFEVDAGTIAQSAKLSLFQPLALAVPTAIAADVPMSWQMVVSFTNAYGVIYAATTTYPLSPAIPYPTGSLPAPVTIVSGDPDVLLSKNDGTPAPSVTLTSFSDQLALVQDGKNSAARQVTFSVSAPGTSSTTYQLSEDETILSSDLGAQVDSSQVSAYDRSTGALIEGESIESVEKPNYPPPDAYVDGIARASDGTAYFTTSTLGYDPNASVGGTETEFESLTGLALGPAPTAPVVPDVALHPSANSSPLSQVAVDPSGDVFLIVPGGVGFAEYAPHLAGGAPIATISGPMSTLSTAVGIATDGAGNVYLAQAAPSGGTVSSIVVFSPPAPGSHDAAPIRSISAVQPAYPDSPVMSNNTISLAVDPGGDAFVAQSLGSMIEFNAGDTGSLAPDAVFADSYGLTAAGYDVISHHVFASPAVAPYPIEAYDPASASAAPTVVIPSEAQPASQIAP